ncbi:MAG: alpha/beta fold hydrolase [Kofleriaceae bacterium]
MLLLHGGLGLDHTSLRPSFDALGDTHRLHYVDLRGNGRSPRPTSYANIDHATWADDLDLVRASRDLPRWTILGHSYGAFIALRYALRHPERVERLILVGSAPVFAHGDAIAANLARKMPGRVEEILGILSMRAETDEHFGSVWSQILPLYYHHYEPRYLAHFADTRYGADAFNHGASFLPTYDVRAELPSVSAPTLVVSADDDWIMPADRAGAALAAGIPNAQHVVIPDAGHFMFHEQPAATLDAIRRFFG